NHGLSFSDVWMAAVGIGGVEEAQAVVVTVEKQVGETLDAQSGLVGMVAGAMGTCAHGEAAGLDASLTEGNGVRSAEFARECGERKGAPGKDGMDRCSTGGASGAMDEFAAIHGGLPTRIISG